MVHMAAKELLLYNGTKSIDVASIKCSKRWNMQDNSMSLFIQSVWYHTHPCKSHS